MGILQRVLNKPEQCVVCNRRGRLTLAAVTEDSFEETSDLSPNSVHWLCEKHFDEVHDETAYSIREIPSPIPADPNLRRRLVRDEQDEWWLVIYHPENKKRWLECHREDEQSLEKYT